jgi:hypothetical protein
MQQFGNLLYHFPHYSAKGSDAAIKQAVAKYIAKFRFYTKHLA